MSLKKTIRLGSRRSPVIISLDPEKDFKRWWQLTIGNHQVVPVVLLIDKTVHRLYQNQLERLVGNISVDVIDTEIVEGGENGKQFENSVRILSRWIQHPVTRDTVVICIGGGSVTDLGGFMAGIFKRGLRTVYIPTTLMAMTDASLGGKNAVNFAGVKNQLGTIHFPAFTLISPSFLSTLPENELRSGYSEMLKHGLLHEAGLLQKILALSDLKTPPALPLLVQSIRVKLGIVNSDPLEKNNRLWLNLGHTYGHACEAFFQSTATPISHGHAVAIGLAEALLISEKQAGFDPVRRKSISDWLLTHFDFGNIPDWQSLSPFIRHDKKNQHKGIRLVLLEKPGSPVLFNCDEALCEKFHRAFLEELTSRIQKK